MTWFVLVSPATFFLIVAIHAAGAVAWAVWDGMEDTRLERERLDRIRHPRSPEELFPGFKISEPGSCPEFQHLLKRLAATRS